MLPNIREYISSQPQPLQHGTIRNRIQNHMVIRPGKIQHSQPINPRLVLRRRMHPMNTRLDQPTRQCSKGVARVYRDRPILRSYPLPLALRIEDL